MVSIEEIGKEFGWKEEEAEEVFVEASSIRQPQHTGYFKTGYPQPAKRYRFVLENFKQNVEEYYFWILNNLRSDNAFFLFDKVTDTFSASEGSAFFGQTSQRLSMQQEKASSFLAIIGKMTKEVFQLVREIRILDERLSHYEDSNKGSEAAEITLKGYWIDLVEGGAKNPASVYGIATQVGFATLPDVFFSTTVMRSSDIDQTVDALDFNRKLKEVLKRKLRAYIKWKEETYKELVQRRRFTLKYLRQHWSIIHMYMSWVKPYLRNIKRLQMHEKHTNSVDMIAGFENSIIEVEYIAKQKEDKAGYHPCVMVSFKYITMPTMQYRQDYHQGPLHMGRVEIDMRLYGWHQEEIKRYIQFRQQEEIEMLELVDSSVKAAMESLSDDLNRFLEEAGEPLQKKEPLAPDKKKRRSSIFDPFISVGKGFGELAGAGVPSSKSKEKKPLKYDSDKAKKAAKDGQNGMWQTYKNFKKAHKMLSW